MRHLYLSIAMLLAVCFAASARQISENEAMLKAAAFGQKAVASRLMSNSRSSAMKLAYTQQSATSTANNCFYVFNRGTADGYVIVSADDRAQSILGYTDSGSFDYASLPSNARWWFSEYQREIQYLIDHPNLKAKAATPKALSTSVAPLCKSLWNQNSPFNDNCPTYTEHGTGQTLHCASGCVATATSQVMYYHQWPVKGTGSCSYTSRQIYGSDTLVYDLSANFSESTYDWANMTDCYNSSSTTAQREAVAKLMSDVGIGLEMSYGPESSSDSGPICNALVSYFGYDPSLSIIWRDLYSCDEWEALIQKELNSKRPVIFGGSGSNGGHQFFCDGYNTDDYYHFNWGWGGTSDGYYKTTALDPPALGIGGGSGGFNYFQDIIIQVMRPTPGYRHYDCLASSINSYYGTGKIGDDEIIMFGKIANLGNRTFNGKIGFVTRNADGKIVDTQDVATISDLAWHKRTSEDYIESYKVPNLSDGVYTMRIESLADGDTLWQQVRNEVGAVNYFTLTITGTSSVLESSSSKVDLAIESVQTPHNIYNNRIGDILVTISNSGNNYHSDINLLVLNANGDTVQTASVVADILNTQSTTVPFNIFMQAPAGNAHLIFTDAYEDSIGEADIQVNAQPDSAVLTLTAAPSFPDKDNVDPKDIHLSVTVNNAGGLYYDNIRANFYDENGNYLGRRMSNLAIDKNETKTITFTDGLAEAAPGKKYTAKIFAYSDTGLMLRLNPVELNSVTFTIKSGQTAIGSVNAVSNRIFPNPASDVVTIENLNAIRDISVYSVTGALVLSKAISGQNSVNLNVASLPAGSYIVRVATAAGTTTQRLIKK
jgi:hypothetical protein